MNRFSMILNNIIYQRTLTPKIDRIFVAKSFNIIAAGACSRCRPTARQFANITNVLALERERNHCIDDQKTSLLSVGKKQNEGKGAKKKDVMTAPTLAMDKIHSNKETKKREEPNQPVLINDPTLGVQFQSLRANDSMLNKLLLTVHSRRNQLKSRQIIVEGWRHINDAIKCDLKLNSLLFSQRDAMQNLLDHLHPDSLDANCKIYKVPQHALKIWSALQTPPGLMAIFQRPDVKCTKKPNKLQANLPISVVCDSIREPGNLGAIIRTCAAMPCEQVIMIKGCCDPWESKALRAGCGGQFRIKIQDDVKWSTLPDFIPAGNMDFNVFIAENNLHKADSMSLSKRKNVINPVHYDSIKNTGRHNVVVVGGETHGVSEDAYRFLEDAHSDSRSLHIPLAGGVESLNVVSALTLILFELRKCILTQV